MSHSHVTREERVVITYLNMMNVSQAEIARRIISGDTILFSVLRTLPWPDIWGHHTIFRSPDPSLACRACRGAGLGQAWPPTS